MHNNASAEFKLIERFFQSKANIQSHANEYIGIGDDCAVLTPKFNTQLAISVDTSIANVHFPDNASGSEVAARALNVALSDLAAMGAKPLAFTLALSLPNDFDTYSEKNLETFMQAFSRGLFDAAESAKVCLIGGDTTKAEMPLSVSITVYGELPLGSALKRSGAKEGDTIYLSRSTGDAGVGLELWLNNNRNVLRLIEAYINPKPELLLGQELLHLSNSCIDVSDGLLADLQHILSASSVDGEIDCDKLQLSEELESHCGKVKALEFALTAGDDYCLCTTAVLLESDVIRLGLIAIGKIKRRKAKVSELVLLNRPKELLLEDDGYDHFK